MSGNSWLWPLLATVTMVTFFACFERMCEIHHARDSYTNRRFLSLRIMTRCFSHAGANCEMQISNYLYGENGCCQEPISTSTIVMTCYWINHILLNLLTFENTPLYLTHSKPDNGHAPFRIKGTLRLFNLCEQNRKLSECLVFLWSGRGCICQTEHLLGY